MIRSAAIALALSLAVSPSAQARPPSLKESAAQTAPKLRQWRRYLHRHPELSNRESQTAAYIKDVLLGLGTTELRTGLAHHGIVAIIRGSQPGKVVALRADMDALPITEASGEVFQSQNPGVMHACGHDAHSAILLGVAAVLLTRRDTFKGSVKLIFQPAEEGAPRGERGGAALMVEDGALTHPKPDAIFGLHVMPELPTGQIGYTSGAAYASVDRLHITILGQQTHAAAPWLGIDPIVTAAQVITALQTVASRTIDARDPVVLSIGRIHGGGRWNIIPGEVVLEGTLRTHNKRTRDRAQRAIRQIATHTAKAQGARAKVVIEALAPVLWNDPGLVSQMLPTLAQQVGSAKLQRVPAAMGGEDFAVYALKIPAFFFHLGVGNVARGITSGLHTPTFRLDESALPIGVGALCALALDYLNGPPSQ